jgi:hypothetical protein
MVDNDEGLFDGLAVGILVGAADDGFAVGTKDGCADGC